MSTRWIVVIGLVGLVLAGSGIMYSKKWAANYGRKDIDKTLSAIEKYKLMQTESAFDFDFTRLNLTQATTEKLIDDGSLKEKLSNFRGKVILLNFWASWCEPCISEFPDMLGLKKLRPDIEIIAVSRDQKIEDAVNFIKTFPESIGLITYYWDPKGEITDLYGTEVLPESYLIGKDFKVLRKIVGMEDWDNPNVLRFIDSL